MAKIRPGPDVSIPLLTKALDDADPAVRLNALATIAEAGKPVVPFLSDSLRTRPGSTLAWPVDLGPDASEAVPGVIEKLKAEKLPVFRRDVIFALGQIGRAAARAARRWSRPWTIHRLRPLDRRITPLGSSDRSQRGLPGLEKQFDAPDAVLKIVSAWALVKFKPTMRS